MPEYASAGRENVRADGQAATWCCCKDQGSIYKLTNTTPLWMQRSSSFFHVHVIVALRSAVATDISQFSSVQRGLLSGLISSWLPDALTYTHAPLRQFQPRCFLQQLDSGYFID